MTEKGRSHTLDAQELEAVLAHELQHIAHRDSLIIWLATLLRDAFCYVLTSWSAYDALQREKELACDDLTVQVTRRPLALASALTKVWLYVLEQGTPTSLAGTQSLEGERQPLLNRIERLRCHSAAMRKDCLAPDVPEGLSRSPLFWLVQVVTLFFLLTLLGCGSLSLILSLLQGVGDARKVGFSSPFERFGYARGKYCLYKAECTIANSEDMPEGIFGDSAVQPL